MLTECAKHLARYCVQLRLVTVFSVILGLLDTGNRGDKTKVVFFWGGGRAGMGHLTFFCPKEVGSYCSCGEIS